MSPSITYRFSWRCAAVLDGHGCADRGSTSIHTTGGCQPILARVATAYFASAYPTFDSWPARVLIDHGPCER
jgi:hypothetical protein